VYYKGTDECRKKGLERCNGKFTLQQWQATIATAVCLQWIPYHIPLQKISQMNIVDPTDMNLDYMYDYELKGCLNYVKEMSHLWLNHSVFLNLPTWSTGYTACSFSVTFHHSVFNRIKRFIANLIKRSTSADESECVVKPFDGWFVAMIKVQNVFAELPVFHIFSVGCLHSQTLDMRFN